MRLRAILIWLGGALALIGLVWIAQGLGYLAWPRSSFMLGDRGWADRGAFVAAAGLVLVLLGRRMRR